MKLEHFLDEDAKVLCKDIKEDITKYSELAQVCLAKVTLFNRRRSGETERMFLQALTEAQTNQPPESVVADALTIFETYLVKSHSRIEIRGKRGWKVPILLTEDM